ncbi:MAG: heavy metal translocating P-type ATPase [Clostridia bacterium]
MAACFHCGLPVPAPGYRARVLGAEREMCCAGCQAVAETIVAGGLESYYATRTSVAAPSPLPSTLSNRSLPRLEGRRGSGEAHLILGRVRCAACLWLIEETLRRLPGVLAADVNYSTERAVVRWDPSRLDLPRILAAIASVGYEATPFAPAARAEQERRENRAALWQLFVAAMGAMQVMMYAFPAYVDADPATLSTDASQLMRWAGLLLTLPVLVFSCRPFFAGAWRELRTGRVGLDLPIGAGIGGAFAASAWATVTASGTVYFDSISMLVFLILAARYVQRSVTRRATRALDRLFEAGQGAEPEVGSLVRVAPGERVPADGVVAEGVSTADESLLTGEPRPVDKRPGDDLVAGSVNLDQPLTMKVTRAGAETRAAALARLVERAAALKPRLVEAAERAARPLTLAVLFLAALAVLRSGDLWTGVAVLVVACPCALALAAPVVLTRSSAALFSRGVLLARSSALQVLERATDVVFDKTGTLTEGKLRLVRTLVSGVLDERGCLALASVLEKSSRHPIALVFQGDASGEAEHVRYDAGRGLEGVVRGQRLRLGAEGYCREIAGGPNPFGAAPAAASRVFLAGSGGWLAAFDLEDQLRADAPALVAALKQRGLRVHLASGDAPEAAAATAARAGIERSTGGMTPEGKLAYVQALQREGRVVVMVGDGVNDAPVLAGADASFAMGGGADSAQLRADVVLRAGALSEMQSTLAVARRAMRLVRENIAWAVAYNVVALPAAALGYVGPLEAALGMGASSVLVLLNALRPLEAATSWKASTSSSPSPSPSYS